MANEDKQPNPPEEDLELYQDEAEDTEESAGVGTNEQRVALPGGEAMTSEEVNRFLLGREASFVTIVGDKDSGKSTIVCAIYDRLLRGPYANLAFAQSRTLMALERRSHYSRIESGRAVPDTPRTSILEGLHYFHLGLVMGDNDRVDLLISDRAGEVYRDARGDSSLIETLPELPQADRLILLIDGRRAANPLERASALQAVRQSLRAFLDGGALGTNSVVQVVTTKMDLISGSADEVATTAALSEFEHRLNRDFSNRVAELSFRKIAARDPVGNLAPAFGLDAMLVEWVTKKPRASTFSVSPPTLCSEFDKLLARTPTGGA
ncbi:TRAFAC clade GTPase domain-containing protein [Rhizobium rhizogenes]|uniref:TRAFAC clade GTPase domain-containing protein n=1 Tax=Rhizobium rhizogenes TaxID=359 RepID=UPI0022CA651A|nr:hypothetical protein [Rhizobium rhizogenes]MCZ7484142.1 hypothetical protein [Rhizobium rhizogenes]